MYSTELFKIIPPNYLHNLIHEKNKEIFSSRELKPIERIVREVKYIMDNTNPIVNGKFYLTQIHIEIRDEVVTVNYVNNFIRFTKLEDDYILITFGKYRDFSVLAIRFGVLCDDIDGVLSFHKEVMSQDDFIRKIMLGEKL